MPQPGMPDIHLPDFRALVDQLGSFFCVKDDKGRYTYINQTGCDLLQRPLHDILGKTDDELFPQAIARALQHNDQRAMASGHPHSCEEALPALTDPGTHHYWCIRAPLRNALGDVTGLSILATDITEARQREHDMSTLKSHYKAVLKSIPDLMFEIDSEGRYHDIHAPQQNLLCAPMQELVGKTIHEMLPPHAAEVCQNALDEAQANGFAGGKQYSLQLPDGLHWFELSAAPMDHRGGDLPHFIVLARDITQRKEAELRLLQKNESLLRAIVDNTPVEYWARDMDGVCIMENAQSVSHWGSLLGKRPDDHDITTEELKLWHDNNARVFAGETVKEEVEYRKNGETRIFLNVLAPIKMDDRIMGVVGFNQDITERKQAEELIRNLAFFDPLCQLPNRRLMFDRLNHAISTCQRHQQQGALLLIDLDNFKQLNDTIGHEAGDQLLREVANRLRTSIRQNDTAARLGGDEFVIILEGLDQDSVGVAQAGQIAQAIQQRLGEPYQLLLDDGQRQLTHRCSASVGIALFQDDSAKGEELLRRADTALYQAKAANRNCVRFFDPAMQALVASRAALESEMRIALEQGQFALHFQPQVDSRNRLVGAEALLRWPHADRGLVSPGEFIPLAETTGLILPLGIWVLEQACRQLAHWARHPATAHLTLAVNVSARQFHQPDFVQVLEQLLQRTGAPGRRLKLELTESLLLDQSDSVIRRMHHLQALGIGFSLDDFGTGYSSLVYLKRLPLAQLKIDRSFVNDILTDRSGAVIARTILALGGSLGLEVIAEGVETHDQRELLIHNGCRRFQGYLFGRAMPLQQFEQLLTDNPLPPLEN